jgi:hypothetical protein
LGGYVFRFWEIDVYSSHPSCQDDIIEIGHGPTHILWKCNFVCKQKPSFINILIVLIPISCACRYLDADYYRRRRVEKENGMNFIESVI